MFNFILQNYACGKGLLVTKVTNNNTCHEAGVVKF